MTELQLYRQKKVPWAIPGYLGPEPPLTVEQVHIVGMDSVPQELAERAAAAPAAEGFASEGANEDFVEQVHLHEVVPGAMPGHQGPTMAKVDFVADDSELIGRQMDGDDSAAPTGTGSKNQKNRSARKRKQNAVDAAALSWEEAPEPPMPPRLFAVLKQHLRGLLPGMEVASFFESRETQQLVAAQLEGRLPLRPERFGHSESGQASLPTAAAELLSGAAVELLTKIALAGARGG